MVVSDKPPLLIINDHFYPGYRAGGPIQSLTNLVVTLEEYHKISILTSAYDLHSKDIYPNINVNVWNKVFISGSEKPVNTWYADKNKPDIRTIKEIINELKPAFIYLNGIFSYRFFIMPLMAVNRSNYKAKLIICPRGMLQTGALAGKSLKKKIYLNTLKLSGLLKNAEWHATNADEEKDIKRNFGKYQRVAVAVNIPKAPLKTIKLPKKQIGLRLVYLSLIAEKKNLLFLLEIIKKCNGVTLDVYGPVKDLAYWRHCKNVIDQMPGSVTYKGEVIPAKVQETFEKYDASVLLTKGENFGHALFESLSVGRPVITSNFTPWNNLLEQKAGWNIEISSVDEGVALFDRLCKIEKPDYNKYCEGAHCVAVNYFQQLKSAHEYQKLFKVETGLNEFL